MKLTLLSRSAAIPSSRRLVEAARARGHQVRVLNPVRVEMHLDGVSANLYYRQKKLFPGDVVIPRIGRSIATYGLAVLNQFAMRGVPQMNTAPAITRARNPMRALQLLSAHGIDIPATVMARDASDLKAMVSLVGGVPVLVKLLKGQDKGGVMVCESLQSLEATLEAILGLGHNLVVQEYVRRTGRDLRVMVVGGQAVAAVLRRPRVGRLAQTLLHGARLEAVTPSPDQCDAAVAAARLMGLEVAAVDMLEAKGKTKVFEVNSSPALTEMEAATGVDLADLIVRRAEQLPRPGAARPLIEAQDEVSVVGPPLLGLSHRRQQGHLRKVK
jgi:ribosomal protein S6--L-glutamate ligase